MKKSQAILVISIIVLGLAVYSGCKASDETTDQNISSTSVKGTWSGFLDGERIFDARFSGHESGIAWGAFDGNNGMNQRWLGDFLVSGNQITFDLDDPNSPDEMSFQGTIESEDRISGTWEHSDGSSGTWYLNFLTPYCDM